MAEAAFHVVVDLFAGRNVLANQVVGYHGNLLAGRTAVDRVFAGDARVGAYLDDPAGLLQPSARFVDHVEGVVVLAEVVDGGLVGRVFDACDDGSGFHVGNLMQSLAVEADFAANLSLVVAGVEVVLD